MMRLFSLCLIAVLLVLPTYAEDDAEVIITRPGLPSADSVALVPIAQDLTRPLYLTHANDDSGRLFIVEQVGRIKVADADGQILQTFLDINALLTWDARGTGGYTERGLLGLVFHPDYADNGIFFVNYTNTDGATVVVRYRVDADDPNSADPNSAEVIFTLPQPFPNHNGGHIAFGQDGYLYISIGDGGAANDPLAAGQNPTTLLGTIIRIDVDSPPQAGLNYAIPADNPFVGDSAGADEVWAYGLRNAWRFSFDRITDDMYVADVGQNRWEEVNFQPAGVGGLNYGWAAYEASHVFNSNISAPDAVMPIAEYDHSVGCSITGGYVYRGEALDEAWQGVYLYSDYCSGRLWGAYRDEAMVWQSGEILNGQMPVSSFGEDQQGELYIIDYRGTVYKLMPAN